MNLQDKLAKIMHETNRRVTLAFKEAERDNEGLTWELEQERAAHKATQQLLDERSASLREKAVMYRELDAKYEELKSSARINYADFQEQSDADQKRIDDLEQKNRDLRAELLDAYLPSNAVLQAAVDVTDAARRALGHTPHFCLTVLGQAILRYQQKVVGNVSRTKKSPAR